MTTSLELRWLPIAYAKAKPLCTRLVFQLYPSLTVDSDESVVTPGTVQSHTVVATPPKPLEALTSPDGITVERIEFTLFTGVLTSEAITFVPAVGQKCVWNSREWFVRVANAKASGDEIVAYAIEAHAL